MSALGQKKNLYVFLKLSHILCYKSVLHINFLAITFSSFSFLYHLKYTMSIFFIFSLDIRTQLKPFYCLWLSKYFFNAPYLLTGVLSYKRIVS